MKNKSWIIILIMGIALTISLVYSIVVSQKVKEPGESTVTTKSIIEMTATTVTIKNTLSGNGNIEYKEKANSDNLADENSNNADNNNEAPKTYKIVLLVEDKDIEKAEIGQKADISIEKEENVFNYIGKVINVTKVNNNKSTIEVEIENSDENIEERISANCSIIVEKAENVVALPIEAIQKDEEGKTYVDVVKDDGKTERSAIKIGISDDYYVEITDGLKVGDRVQIIKSSVTTIVKDKESKTSEK